INNTHKWVTRIILCLGAPLLIGAFVFSYPEIYLLLLIGLLVIQNGFDAYMEYKHQTEEKEYMIYLVWMMGTFVILFGFMFFTLKTTTVKEVTNGFKWFNQNNIEDMEIRNNAWSKEKESIYPKRKANIEDLGQRGHLLSKMS